MLATRQPVLRRFWYPVMPAALVDQGPQPFTLLDERIVLWKDGSGRYAAMADRCPHRSAAAQQGLGRRQRACLPLSRLGL